MTQRISTNGAAHWGRIAGLGMILVGLATGHAFGQGNTSANLEPSSRNGAVTPCSTGGFGTLVPSQTVSSDPRTVREQLAESLKSAMRKLVEAEKKPLSDQRRLLIDSATDWDQASMAADKTAQAEAKSAAELQKQRDALRGANRPMLQSLEEFNKTLGDVQQQLATVKQSAERARQEAVEAPDSPLKQAAAKQWYRQQRQVEMMVANLQSLHAAITQPAVAAQAHLMLLEGLIQVHTVQANSLQQVSTMFRSTAKAQRIMADVLKIESTNGNDPVLTVDDLPEATLSGPALSLAEERDFAGWLQGTPGSSEKNR